MFNSLISIYELFLLSLASFFIIFTSRLIFIRRKVFVLLYHSFFFCILFIAAIGGGGVQNSGYKRLEDFIRLEKNDQLQEAKKNPHGHESIDQLDLEQFQNSTEFRDYLEKFDRDVDNAEAVSIGWIFVMVAELSLMFAQLLIYICNKTKKLRLWNRGIAIYQSYLK